MWQMLETVGLYFHGTLKSFLNLFSDEGKQIHGLSRDHKPSDELEKKRILEAGGQIYQ
jgi:hypothetical protein